MMGGAGCCLMYLATGDTILSMSILPGSSGLLLGSALGPSSACVCAYPCLAHTVTSGKDGWKRDADEWQQRLEEQVAAGEDWPLVQVTVPSPLICL